MSSFFKKFSNVKFRDILHFFLFFAALPVALVYKRRRRDLWLVCDNGTEAADNGFVFFKYVCETHPEQDCVFAVNKNSPDREKVEQVGNTVNYGSFKHWILYLTARVNISSQKGGKPNYAVCNLLEVYGILKNSRVFLQHGIIYNDLEFLHYKNSKMSMFMTSTERERSFIVERFGYSEKSVKLTGIARLDNLHGFQVEQGQILVMPTWREWLGNSTLTKNLKKNVADFVKTDYYKNWNELLASDKLKEICEKYRLKVMFYLHRDAQRFADCFELDSRYVTVCKYPEYKVDELLKSSAFLITDYSSIHMDFAYMKKPIAYFQFDYDRFYSEHYREGYFTFSEDGFGPTFSDSKELTAYVESSAKNGFENDEKYLKRHSSFFTLYDTENCKRNYEAIKEQWS